MSIAPFGYEYVLDEPLVKLAEGEVWQRIAHCSAPNCYACQDSKKAIRNLVIATIYAVTSVSNPPTTEP